MRALLHPLLVVRRVGVGARLEDEAAEVAERVDVVVEIGDVVGDVAHVGVHHFQALLEHLAHACERRERWMGGEGERDERVRTRDATRFDLPEREVPARGEAAGIGAREGDAHRPWQG